MVDLAPWASSFSSARSAWLATDGTYRARGQGGNAMADETLAQVKRWGLDQYLKDQSFANLSYAPSA